MTIFKAISLDDIPPIETPEYPTGSVTSAGLMLSIVPNILSAGYLIYDTTLPSMLMLPLTDKPSPSVVFPMNNA